MQSRSSQPEAIAITESETHQTLLARAHRRTGGVPPESIVRHVLSVTHGGDWPVQRDALDAVLRRCASTHTDEIQIVGRPRNRTWGLYATRRRGSRARPYRTLLRRIEPLDGSCECADFLRNSLGLCKHLVAVLECVISRPRRGDIERELAPERAPLRWDPVRPLTGPGDWLARIRWVDGTPDRELRHWLRPAKRNGWTVAVPGASQQRLALVDRLLAALRDGNGEPALHALLQEERARLARQIQTASTRKHLNHALHTLKQSLYRYQLTGTPMENRLDELASIVEWVDDLALEPKWRLAAWHTTPVDGKTEISGARNLETLRTRLATCMVRRVRHEVLSQLPARTDTRIPIEMTAEQLDEHDALNMPIAQVLGRAKRRPLTQPEFLRLMSLLTTQRIIANGLAQLRFEQIWPDLSRIERPTDSTLRGLASPKLVELRELIGQLALAEGRKVVVFSQWRRMLRLAHWATRHQLAREGVTLAFFTGQEGQRRRTQNLVDFHDDPACRVLFATDAGGVGLNLQRAASACINIELPWNPAVLEQRIGRIYRLGQRRPIDVYNLVSEPGIESRIADLVGSKKAFFTGLFDGTTDEVAFERSGSFLSRIERIVAPAVSPAPARGKDVSVFEDDGAEREIEAVVAAGDESCDVAGAAAPKAEPMPSAATIQRLVAGVTVQRTASGGLVIEAPPETASTLGALFSGMAQLLQAATLRR